MPFDQGDTENESARDFLHKPKNERKRETAKRAVTCKDVECRESVS